MLIGHWWCVQEWLRTEPRPSWSLHSGERECGVHSLWRQQNHWGKGSQADSKNMSHLTGTQRSHECLGMGGHIEEDGSLPRWRGPSQNPPVTVARLGNGAWVFPFCLRQSSPGCPRTHCVSFDHPEILSFLPPPSQGWDYRCSSPYLADVLGIKPRSSCEHSANWAWIFLFELFFSTCNYCAL